MSLFFRTQLTPKFITKNLLIASICLGLSTLLIGCTPQPEKTNPFSQTEVNKITLSSVNNLPKLSSPPAINIRPTQTPGSVTKNLFLVARRGSILVRYELPESFDLLFTKALNSSMNTIGFPILSNTPYVLDTEIKKLIIHHHTEGLKDFLSGQLTVYYFIRLNGIMIWNRSFESIAEMTYIPPQNPSEEMSNSNQEKQAIAGVLHFLVKNNIALFANQLNQECEIKNQGIQC